MDEDVVDEATTLSRFCGGGRWPGLAWPGMAGASLD